VEKKFSAILLEEAFEFVQKQDLKSRMKILHNIRRVEQHSDQKFFKKLTVEIWDREAATKLISNTLCRETI
jgi:hypothetical protein